jgi:hypothetical protein
LGHSSLACPPTWAKALHLNPRFCLLTITLTPLGSSP